MAKQGEILNRRIFLTGAGAFGLAGCTQSLDMSAFQPDIDMSSTGSVMRPQISVDKGVTSNEVMYAAVHENGYSLPAIPYEKVPKQFRRQIVPDPTGEVPGTIVVRLNERYLYLVLQGARPCVMASASDVQALNGQAVPMCNIRSNGRAGHHRRK